MLCYLIPSSTFLHDLFSLVRFLSVVRFPSASSTHEKFQEAIPCKQKSRYLLTDFVISRNSPLYSTQNANRKGENTTTLSCQSAYSTFPHEPSNAFSLLQPRSPESTPRTHVQIHNKHVNEPEDRTIDSSTLSPKRSAQLTTTNVRCNLSSRINTVPIRPLLHNHKLLPHHLIRYIHPFLHILLIPCHQITGIPYLFLRSLWLVWHISFLLLRLTLINDQGSD